MCALSWLSVDFNLYGDHHYQQLLSNWLTPPPSPPPPPPLPVPAPIPTRWPHSRGIARYIIRGVRFILSLHPIRDPLLPVKEQLDTTVIAGGGKLAAAEQYFMHDACRGQYKDVVYFTHENAIMTRH